MTSPALAERYGVERPWRRRIIVGVCSLIFASLAAWLAWTIESTVTPEVSSDLETWKIVDDHTATAVLVVNLRKSTTVATCKLQATAEDHTVVGEFSFTPDPDTRSQSEQIRTDREATSVQSLGCTAPGQTRPR